MDRHCEQARMAIRNKILTILSLIALGAFKKSEATLETKILNSVVAMDGIPSKFEIIACWDDGLCSLKAYNVILFNSLTLF